MAERAPPLKNPPPDNSKVNVLVLGCGIIGLSAALTLQRLGFKVEIWAKDLPPNTTSNKAGAYWYPYSVFPLDRAHNWAKATFFYYRDFLSKIPRAGLLKASCVHLYDQPHTEPNFYEGFVPNSRKATKEELPPGFVDGDVLETFSIDVDNCLEFLFDEFLLSGGRILRKTVNNIEEAFAYSNYVINCTGLGARELFNDKTVFAGRGQTIVVRGNGHETVISTHNGTITYVIPRGGDIVLGGTFQEGNESLLISEEDTRGIIDRCSKLYKTLEKPKLDIIREKVGLRPCRPAVRLEKELYHGGKKVVIHNYGHGGAGWSTCYGCAFEVAEILQNHLGQPVSKL